RPGSFAAALRAVRFGFTRGLEPLATVCHDMTEPIGKGAVLRLSLTNVLNRPIAGTLLVDMIGLKLDNAVRVLEFKPHETKVVRLAVEGQPRADNTYPLTLRFDAGKDGTALHEETMHVNIVARRTPKIDGVLDDWKGALPQILITDEAAAPTLTEAAWLPFVKFDTSVKKGFATGYLAYDKNNFYFAAKIADASDDGGTLRFATRDDDQFYYPEVSYLLKAETVLQKRDTVRAENSDEPRALQKPDGSGRIMAAWETTVKTFAVDVNLPKPQQVALYFQDWDEHVSVTENGRRNVKVTILDRDSGQELDSRDIKNFRLGKYLVYNLSGHLRLKISTNSWISGVLNGLFFDASTPLNPPLLSGDERGVGSVARFVKVDEATQGNWKGVYGGGGYVVVGAGQKLPAGVTVETPEFLEKTSLKWPEGVRRYSYRMRPILPSGNAPNFDNVQLAFNVLPPAQKPWYSHPPGTMPGYIGYYDTDYEYALNHVAPAHGGGTEIWRLRYPGMPHKHFYPRQGKSPFDGPSHGGQLAITRDATTRYVECALPWSEIPGVKAKLDAGQRLKFSFRVNDNAGGAGMELAKNRSVAKLNGSFRADWVEHWANEVEFGWEK
ncbi:MAG: hypothetical protein M3347_05745, partial [Armatimonadota bacterium]|nr:hypothetical protein [Armatimonadota bacterium]